MTENEKCALILALLSLLLFLFSPVRRNEVDDLTIKTCFSLLKLTSYSYASTPNSRATATTRVL